MKAEKLRPIPTDLPLTKNATIKEIQRVCQQIIDIEIRQKKPKQESLWNYKRRLIGHLHNL